MPGRQREPHEPSQSQKKRTPAHESDHAVCGNQVWNGGETAAAGGLCREGWEDEERQPLLLKTNLEKEELQRHSQTSLVNYQSDSDPPSMQTTWYSRVLESSLVTNTVEGRIT